MRLRYPGFLCVFLLLFCAPYAWASDEDAPASQKLAASLQHALDTPGTPYHLQVNCTDNKGNRSFELFSGGVTVWNRRSQVILPQPARAGLLTTLIERGFPEFDEVYGGQQRPEKSAAPARISCRVWIEIDNLEKGSVQMAGGDPSAKLSDLAAELLDQVEEYSDIAVTPNDLEDALIKLGEKQLAPQTLQLRFVELPAANNHSSGYILRLTGGQLSQQTYSPGQEVGELSSKPLNEAQFTRLLETIQAAQITHLSGNMWSEDRIELEVQVLAHKKVILARRFSRLDSTAQDSAQQRFDELLLVLREYL